MIDFLNLFLEKPIKIIVFFTFLFAVSNLQLKNTLHRYLIIVLLIWTVTEVINTVLIYNGKSIVLTSTVGIIFHQLVWLLILKEKIYFKKVFYVLLGIYMLFTMVNLIFIDGINHFNAYTFVLGAFIYISIFIYESFYELRQEQFSSFLSNSYLLFFSPILFFFGLSFAFAFHSKLLLYTTIIADINLYDFIIYFVNIIYYALINVYIYRERKLKHA